LPDLADGLFRIRLPIRFLARFRRDRLQGGNRRVPPPRPALRRPERQGLLMMAGSEEPALVPKASSELKTRVLSAVVMIALALGTAYWGGLPFALFWLAAGIATMFEWTDMTGLEPRRVVQAIFALGLAGLTLQYVLGGGLVIGAMTGLVF